MEDETLPYRPAPAVPSDPENLRHLGGYDLLEVLGQGAMGVVYRARDRTLHRDVALKVLKPHLLESPLAVARFRREAAAAARLSHPNLLPIYEIGKDNGCWFFSMELAGGETLLDLTARRAKLGEPSLVEQDRDRLAAFLRRFAEVCDALHLAHERGIIHRDIKPSNILIAADGTMKLVDFGLAKDLEVEQLTMTGTMLGTPLYMSPEQISGDISELDRRSDVYSLGVTLYEALTLRKPFETRSFPTLVGKILSEEPPSPRKLGLRFPPDLEAVLFKAIEKDPDRRYATAAEFADDLRQFVDYEPVLARPQGAWVRLRKALKRNRRVVRAVAVTTVAVLMLVLLPTLITLGERSYEGVRSWFYNRQAWELYGRAMVEPPAERARLLGALLESHPDADARAGALLSLGRARLALREWEEARAAWSEAYYAAPDTAAGQSALLNMAREFHEVGRRHVANDAVQDILARPVTAGVEARAHLLAGEIALAADRPEEAVWHLHRAADLSRGAGIELGPRIASVNAVLSDFFPSRFIDTPDLRAVVAGCFRQEGRPELLLVGTESCELIRVRSDGEIERTPVPIRLGSLGSSPTAGDLDGDGLDDLVHPSQEGEWESTERLRAFSLAEETPRLICNLPIIHTAYETTIGDFDGDGRNDLFLGMSFPKRGVAAFRNCGPAGFVPQPVGDLARLGPLRSDGRDVAICDLDGDGRNEVVVAAEGFAVHSPVVARFVSPERGFREVSAEYVGFVNNLEVFDADEDGRPEVYFGLECYLYSEIADLYPQMRAQGLYRMAWDGDAGEPEIRPVYRHRTIRFGTGDLMQPMPLNLAITETKGGRAGATGPFLLTWRKTTQGLRSIDSFLAVERLGAGAGQSILIPSRPGPGRPGLCVADLNGDGDSEIVVLEAGRLRIGGLGGEVVPRAPDRNAAVPGSARHASAEGLSIADRLRSFENYAPAERAYRAVMKGAPGSMAAARAMEGLISIRGLIRDYDRCLVLIAEYERRYPEQARRARYLRACTLHDAGDLPTAAREYGVLEEVRGLEHAEQARVDRLATALRPWLEVSEVPLPGFARLPVSAPGTFTLGSDGLLRGRDRSMQRTTIWWPLAWSGGSFRLDFDLKVDALDWSRGVRVGFQKIDSPQRCDEGLYFSTAYSSTMPRAGSINLRSADASSADNWSQRGGLELPIGQWLRYRFVYDAPTHAAFLAVRDEEGAPFYFLRIDPPFRVDPVGHLLSVLVRAGDRSEEIAFAVRNVRLFQPRGEQHPLAEDPGPPGDFDAVGEANGALLRGDEPEALGLFREFLVTHRPEDSQRAALAAVAAAALEWRVQGSRDGLAAARQGAETLHAELADVLRERRLLSEKEIAALLK